jgi:hypothetical protein
VTGGHGGGSPAFAQGGGARLDDLPGTEHRIAVALGLEPAGITGAAKEHDRD